MSQYRPSINELLLAVLQFVTECTSELQGQTRFHALSSSYVLGICERELRLGPIYEREERERLSQFLQASGTLDQLRDSLCTQIRAGVHDSASDALLRMLLAMAVNDVRIVKPEHLAPDHRAGDVSE